VFRSLGSGDAGLAVGFGGIRAEVTDHGGQKAHGNFPGNVGSHRFRLLTGAPERVTEL